MEKKEIRYFMLFFAFLTALLFGCKDFNILLFVIALFLYAAYFLAVYVAYKLTRKGALYVYKVFKECYKEIDKTRKRLGNNK